MTSRVEPLRRLHSVVRSGNGKISLPSVRRLAIFGKKFGFFFQNFRVLRWEDAEIPQPSSARFNDNRELITKYYLNVLGCYNFSGPPLPGNSGQVRPI